MSLTQSFVTAGVSSPAAETAILTTASVPVAPPANASGVIIRGSLNVTAGTSTTAVVLRCRVGGVAGAQIGNALTVTLAAGSSASIPFDFVDPSFGDPGAGYTITLAQTANTVAGTVNQAMVDLDIAIA